MKISLSWVLDHIEGLSFNKISITQLVDRFIQTTAEIEEVTKVTLKVEQFELVTIIKQNNEYKIKKSDDSIIALAARNDLVVGGVYLIINDDQGPRWATSKDFFAQKEMAIPQLHMEADELHNFRSLLEPRDYILTIDNKSINHRPDLWSHRGIAREIAALYNRTLKPLDSFITQLPVDKNPVALQITKERSVSLALQQNSDCLMIAGLPLKNVKYTPSLLFITQRLCRVEARSINGLVDFTNYVMFDIGQPMHAFDRDAFHDNHLVVRKAVAGEKLLLLDDTTVDLTNRDIVIANSKQPLSLAGIMGGKHSAVSAKTKNLYLESACFDATTIRQSALHHKKRTEASARYEKSLDPHQPTHAIERYLKLLDQYDIDYVVEGQLSSVGSLPEPTTIWVAHADIEKRLGISLSKKFILITLHNLDCKVTELKENKKRGYAIEVPSFRATKDLKIAEDIIEEIGRFYGYKNLPIIMPTLPVSYKDTTAINRMADIKKYLAYAGRMKEVYSYALYDEIFLQKLNFEPVDAIQIKNPISEHWQRLVTSLIPHLLKAVAVNYNEAEQLSFFEFAKIFKQEKVMQEKNSIAGILYNTKREINFYDVKAIIDDLCIMFDIELQWQQLKKIQYPWYQPYKSALLVHNDVVIGTAGFLEKSVFVEPFEGFGFVFELDGDYLLQYKSAIKQLEPIPKYPEVTRDISMSAPLLVTIDQLTNSIETTDARIKKVLLIDLYQKKEWRDQRAITFRLYIQDQYKTLPKEEVELLMEQVMMQLKKFGVTIR